MSDVMKQAIKELQEAQQHIELLASEKPLLTCGYKDIDGKDIEDNKTNKD
jgi:hypothetical protein